MNASQNEALRHAVLEIIATRHPAALTVRAIRRRAADEVDFPIADDHVEGALHFIKGLGHVLNTPDPLGSSDYWAATTTGVLAFERGLKPNTPKSKE